MKDNEWFESPVFSPDGRKIAFLSLVFDAQDAFKNISVKSMDPDGKNLTLLVEMNTSGIIIGYNPGRRNSVSLCWSPDGTKILFTLPAKENSCSLFVINSDGSDLTRITDNTTAFDMDVSWSK